VIESTKRKLNLNNLNSFLVFK